MLLFAPGLGEPAKIPHGSIKAFGQSSKHFIHKPLLEGDLPGRNIGVRCNAVKRHGTPCYGVKQDQMPVTIDDILYYTAIEITKELGISRTTLWRWRSDGKIPAGRLYRGGTVVFTSEEFDAVRAFANRLEPVLAPNRD